MLIAGNWKMNHGLSELKDFLKIFNSIEIPSFVDICFMPPFPLLFEAKKLIKNSGLNLGAQCSHYKMSGSFTGDISPKLLSELGCGYVIAGHSERRIHHLETNEFVKNSVISIISKKMIPIVCVGETIDQKKNGKTKDVIKHQINHSVPLVEDSEIVVAYEPLWAIGTGKIPEHEDIREVHSLIKEELKSINYLKVIYGGSVNNKNCNDIFSLQNVDGALVGGASLNFKEFLAIFNSAVKQVNRLN